MVREIHFLTVLDDLDPQDVLYQVPSSVQFLFECLIVSRIVQKISPNFTQHVYAKL